MRVVIAEDLYLLREGLVHLLRAHGMEIAAAVESGPELLKALTEERPDVAIVDVRLPPTFTDEGLQAALRARRKVPGLPVLVLSQHVEQLYARESKIACSTPSSSSTRCAGSPRAAPRWIRR
jgi:DNA-binding NarL/FixJ family response regulator